MLAKSIKPYAWRHLAWRLSVPFELIKLVYFKLFTNLNELIACNFKSSNGSVIGQPFKTKSNCFLSI